MRARNRTDVLRAATTLALAAAQPLSTRMARWTGRGRAEIDQATASEGPVTPVGWAFVIWAPLFAGSLAYGATDLRRVRAGEAASGAAGWWANAALAGNVAWSLNSQFRRLDEVSVALILGSASAATASVALAERDPAGQAGRAASRCVGPLAGWLCVAGFANIETTRNLRRGRPVGEDAVPGGRQARRGGGDGRQRCCGGGPRQPRVRARRVLGPDRHRGEGAPGRKGPGGDGGRPRRPRRRDQQRRRAVGRSSTVTGTVPPPRR